MITNQTGSFQSNLLDYPGLSFRLWGSTIPRSNPFQHHCGILYQRDLLIINHDYSTITTTITI